MDASNRDDWDALGAIATAVSHLESLKAFTMCLLLSNHTLVEQAREPALERLRSVSTKLGYGFTLVVKGR